MVKNSGDTDCCTYNINNMLNSKKGEIWQSLISKLAFSASCEYLNLLFRVPHAIFSCFHEIFSFFFARHAFLRVVVGNFISPDSTVIIGGTLPALLMLS